MACRQWFSGLPVGPGSDVDSEPAGGHDQPPRRQVVPTVHRVRRFSNGVAMNINPPAIKPIHIIWLKKGA